MMKRRQFLLTSAAMAMMTNGRMSLAASALKTDRMVILIELAGGNDGLNTLVPMGQSVYRRKLRPEIAIPEKRLITLSNRVGLHPAFGRLGEDVVDLAWVQNVGYPAHSRSHFTAIADWHAGSDGKSSPGQGWAARLLDAHRLEHEVDILGVSLDGALGPFHGGAGLFLDLGDLDLLRELQQEEAKAADNPLLSVISQRTTLFNDTIRLIRERLDVADAPEALLERFPWGDLGEQAARAIRLIAAGIRVPIIKLRLDGFDTHSYQPDEHAALLAELARTIGALRYALTALGRWDDAIIATYSEFGRQLAENASGGTDHGEAGPMLITGGAVKGGLIGEMADLEAIKGTDLPFRTDYRTVLDALVTGHLGLDAHLFTDFRDDGISRNLGLSV